MKVLVPVEDRLFGELIVDFISRATKWTDVSITVLHVIPTYQMALAWPSKVINEDANSLVSDVAERCKSRLPKAAVRTEVQVGAPAKVINELAQQLQVDAVVLGATSKSGLGQWLAGSVSSEVAMHCERPVYIVRPGFANDEHVEPAAVVPQEAEHRRYLEEHITDRPFPLNGSDWSRLVSTRLEHEDRDQCKDPRCEDLLTRIHSLETPLPHERAAMKQAMHYWFLTGLKQYKPQPLADQTDSGMHALEVLTRLKSDAALQEAERQWMKKRVKAWRLSPGGFWIADRGESTESAEQLPAVVEEVNKLPAVMDQGAKKEEAAHVEAK